jgi:hypothetical protein
MAREADIPEGRSSDDFSCSWAEHSGHRLKIPQFVIRIYLGVKDPMPYACLYMGEVGTCGVVSRYRVPHEVGV